MNALKIYYGAPNPIRVYGVNVCNLVSFAERYRGWHTIGKLRANRRALESAIRSCCIEAFGDQFRFVYPRG